MFAIWCALIVTGAFAAYEGDTAYGLGRMIGALLIGTLLSTAIGFGVQGIVRLASRGRSQRWFTATAWGVAAAVAFLLVLVWSVPTQT
jgi:hypothetical protein